MFKGDVVEFRLQVINFSKKIGNISLACKICGVDRASYYKWLNRYQAQGSDGLMNRSPVRTKHSAATPEKLKKRIKELCMENPSFGCDRLEKILCSEENRVSSVTIQKILNSYGLGTQLKRYEAVRLLVES